MLWPKGCVSVEDLPHDLATVTGHGLLVQSWRENLPRDEMPPRWMWHLDWELKEWFEEVELLREQKYGGGSEDGSMVKNELADGMRT